MREILFFLILLFFSGCSYHYSYSSQPEQKPVATTIETVRVSSFKGFNIEPAYQVWFESALRQSLQKRSFINLSQASENSLHVNVTISPVWIRRYRDVDMFKTKVFVVYKSVHLEAEYELFDAEGNSIVQSSYGNTAVSSSETSTSYADADNKRPLHVIHKDLMQSMAEAIAQRVIDATEVF
jgi:hypothetical protein